MVFTAVENGSNLTDLDALVGVLRDLPEGISECEFKGLRIEILPKSAAVHLAVAASAGFLAAAALSSLRREPEGDTARVWFPKSAGLDLVVLPHGRDADVGASFSSRYQVQCLVPKLGARFLGRELRDVLTELWEQHSVSVRDEYVEISPVPTSPEKAADIFGRITDAILSRKERAPVEGQGSLDAFCFYCGHAVSSSALECPHCEGDLSPE